MKNSRIWTVAAGWAALIAAGVLVDVPVSRWVQESGLSTTLKSQWPWLLWSVRRFGVFWSYPLGAAIIIVLVGLRKNAVAPGNRSIASEISPSPGTPGEGRGEGLRPADAAMANRKDPSPYPSPGVPGEGTIASRHIGDFLEWGDVVFVLIGGVLSGLNSPVKWIVGRHRPYHGYGVFEVHPCQGPIQGLIGMESGLSFPSGDVCLAAATSTCLAILFPRWRWALILVVLLVALERVAEGAHYPSDVAGGALLGWAMALVAKRITAKWRGQTI